MISNKTLSDTDFSNLRGMLISKAAEERLRHLRIIDHPNNAFDDNKTIYLLVDNIIDPNSDGCELDMFIEEATSLFKDELTFKVWTYEGLKAQYYMSNKDSLKVEALEMLKSAIEINSLDEKTPIVE